jgi:hypothetical protein
VAAAVGARVVNLGQACIELTVMPPGAAAMLPCHCCCASSAVQHFDLVEDKELAPLSELIEQFLAGKMNSLR